MSKFRPTFTLGKPRTTNNTVVVPQVRRNNYNLLLDGNSITIYIGWSEALRSDLTAKGDNYTFGNYAVSGQTITQMNADASTQIDGAFVANKLNIVTCWEVVNDYRMNGASLNYTYDQMVTYCQNRRARGFKVLVCTTMPSTYPTIPTTFEADRLIMNQRFRDNYTSYADGLVDIGGHPILGNIAYCPDTRYFVDLIHLASLGHNIAKVEWLKGIEKILYA